KLREAYMDTVGDELTRDIPVDLRMSASGVGKKSRMIGGNLAELIASNIIGNLRGVPLEGETLMEQIKRQPLAKVQIGDTASGIEARKFASLYKEALGLRGKYGEEYIYDQAGELEKAIAGSMHVMVMKEPKAWVPKGASHLVSGESKMTVDPHGWFGLKKVFQPGGALEKEFTLRAFPEAREAGALIDAFRSFAKLRETEMRKDTGMPTIGFRELTDKRMPGYVEPLRRKATVADLSNTLFDPFKFGRAMALRLPEPSAEMREEIEKQVQEGVKKGEQVMPVKTLIGLPEIKGRKYVTSDTGEVLPATVSRYMSELVEATRRYYQLSSRSKDPEVLELKRTFINDVVGDFYNKLHAVRDVNVQKELLGKLEEQILPMIGHMRMPQFKATSSLLADPTDPSKVYFPTIYQRIEGEAKTKLEEAMKGGVTIKDAYENYIKPSLAETDSNMKFFARILKDFVTSPMIYADKNMIGRVATTNLSEGGDPRYRTQNLITNQMLDSLVKDFRHYQVERDPRGKITGTKVKSVLDVQYDEIRRNLQSYYDEMARMIYGRGLLADVALKKKVPALYLTAHQRPYDMSDELRQAIKMVERHTEELPESGELSKELADALRAVEKIKIEKPAQWLKRGEIKIGERDLKEMQKAGQATPELQDKVDDVYALINRQPTTDEFSYRAMKLTIDDMQKDLSGIVVVPGLPIGDHPVMQAMEKAQKALEDLREKKLKMLEDEFSMSGGRLTERAESLQREIAEIDKLTKDLRPMYHEASMKLDFDGDMMAVHAATTQRANEELKKIQRDQVEAYGDTRRLLYEELSYVPESKRSLGAKGAGLSPEEMRAMGFGGQVSAASPIWEPMDIEAEVSKVAKRNLLDIHSMDPETLAEDTLKHFVHKIEMGQGYEAFNRIGFLYRGADPKGMGLTPQLHETYSLLMGEFLRSTIQKVIGGKHGSEGSELSPKVQKAFFTGNIDEIMEFVAKADVTEEALSTYRYKYLRPMSKQQIMGEAKKYGIDTHEKSRKQLIDEIVQKTSFKSMFEHLFDQVRRLALASVKEQYRTGLATDQTMSRTGAMGLAKFLAGRPGYDDETLKTLGLKTKFQFAGGDFKAFVDKKDVTDYVMEEMRKDLNDMKMAKEELAFMLVTLGKGIKKVRKGDIGDVHDEIVETGDYISDVFRGLQPMYKLKTSGGASMAVSSYTKRGDSPNEFTPGGPALSYAEVLDYVIRSGHGTGVKVGPMLGTFGDVAEQKPYEYNSPAMQAYREFERTRKRITDVMSPKMYKFEGMLEQMQSFSKDTAGTLGELRKVGVKSAYDKDTQQLYIDQSLKSAFEESLREYALARNKEDRMKYRSQLDETMQRIKDETKKGVAYKYIHIGEGEQAEDLRTRIADVADMRSKWKLRLDTMIEQMVSDVKMQPKIKEYLESKGRTDLLDKSNIQVTAALRTDPAFRQIAAEEIAASYLSGGAGYGSGITPLIDVARQGYRLWGQDKVINLEKEIDRGIVGRHSTQDFRAFSLMFKDKWLEAAEKYAERPSKEDWMSIYKAHPALRDQPVPAYDKPYEKVIEDLREAGAYGGSKGATHFLNSVLKQRMAQIIEHMEQGIPEDWDELRFDKLAPYVEHAIQTQAEEVRWPFRAAPTKGADIESILGAMGKPVGKARVDVERVFEHAFNLTRNQWRQIFNFDPEAQKVAMTSRDPIGALTEAGMYGQNRGYTRYINMIFKRRMEYILNQLEAEAVPDFYSMRFQKSREEFLKTLESEVMRQGEFPGFVSAGGPWGGYPFGPKEAFGPNAPENIRGGRAYTPARQFPVYKTGDESFIDLESSALTAAQRKVIERISKAAKEAGVAEKTYLGGGAVRNLLMGKEPRDLDLWVEGEDNLAKLAEKLKDFKKFDWTNLFGWKYFEFPDEGITADITYAQKNKYKDGGWLGLNRKLFPEEGTLADTVRELDFTGNSMQVRLSDNQLKDMLSGSGDVRRGILRAIDPANYFRQTPVGLLRAARFETLHGLTPDYFTEFMMKRDASKVDNLLEIQVSRELEKIPLDKMDHFRTVLDKYGVRTERLERLITQFIEKPAEEQKAFAPAYDPNALMSPAQKEALDKIRKAAAVAGVGEGAFISGGATRNMMLGQAPRDLDIIVEGKDKMEKLWQELKDYNKWTWNNLFGYKLLSIPTSSGENVPVDLAYSATNKYIPGGGWGLTGSRGRKFFPFTTEATVDEAARENDLTGNALYMRLSDFDVRDPLGAGAKDLERGLLRAIQPTKLFTRSPVSLMRAARFEANLGLVPDEITAAFMRQDAKLVDEIPMDQLIANLRKISDNKMSKFKEILEKYGFNTESVMEQFNSEVARRARKAEMQLSAYAPADYPGIKPIFNYPRFTGTEASLQYKSHGDQVKLSVMPTGEVAYGTKRQELDPATATARYRPYIEYVNREVLPNIKELAKTHGRVDLFGEWGGQRDKMVWFDAMLKGKSLPVDDFYRFARKAQITPAEEIYRGPVTPEVIERIFRGKTPFKGLEEGVVAKELGIDEGRDFARMAKIKTKDYLTGEEARYPWLDFEQAERNIEAKFQKLMSRLGVATPEAFRYSEGMRVLDVKKQRMEEFLKGLNDIFLLPVDEVENYKKKQELLLQSGDVRQPVVVKDAVVMKKEDFESSVISKGQTMPWDEALVLNVRKIAADYPQAVPISKEPGFMYPGEAQAGDVGKFIVHKHDAKRAGPHQDVRFEVGGQLQSFAMPKDLPTAMGQRRLAIGPTAHHQFDFYEGGDYEIPEGFYGAGKMSTFDVGKAVIESIDKDKVTVRLEGEQGQVLGTFSFVHYVPKGEDPRKGQWVTQQVRPLEFRDPGRFSQIYPEKDIYETAAKSLLWENIKLPGVDTQKVQNYFWDKYHLGGAPQENAMLDAERALMESLKGG
ncbi:hypothetical protein GF377_11200, partial [candidate division GN15 bacterium]|nr:hypothetical protein [candidate division GN15 bacterium]